jgi:hypothetical protein
MPTVSEDLQPMRLVRRIIISKTVSVVSHPPSLAPFPKSLFPKALSDWKPCRFTWRETTFFLILVSSLVGGTGSIPKKMGTPFSLARAIGALT